jgi:hypothetical protein
MMQMHYFDERRYYSFSLCFSVAHEAVGGGGRVKSVFQNW